MLSILRPYHVLSGVAWYFLAAAIPAAGAGIDDGLLAYYQLNEGRGTTTSDNSRRGHTADLLNSPLWVQGKYGQALQFTGGGEYLSVAEPANDELDPHTLTLTAWVYPSVVGDQHHYIVSKHRDCCDSPGQGGYGLRINRTTGVLQGEIWLASSQSLAVVRGSTPLPANQWSHVAFTFDGIEMSLYVNGIQDGVYSLPGADTIQATSNNLTIGVLAYRAPTYYSFNGLIDEVRLYNRALGETEIQSLVSAVGGDPALLFYESFDNQSSITENGGDGANYQLLPGRMGNGVHVESGASLSFPALNAIDAMKGTISFWFKPDWAGDDPSAHYFFQWGSDKDSLRIQKYYNGTSGINYFVFRYDDADLSQREVSTHNLEPGAIMSWQPDEWHFIEVIWDLSGESQYMAFIIDGSIAKTNKKTWIRTALNADRFFVGTSSTGSFPMSGMIDDLKIYAQPAFDINNPVTSYMELTRGDGAWQTHETVHNSPMDAPIMDNTVAPGEPYVFFSSMPFAAVYDGTVPTTDAITDSFFYRVAQDEYEPLFFNIYSREDLADVEISVGDFVGPEGVIAKSHTDVRVVKNWFQAGRTAQRDIFPAYTPELLLSDDRIAIEGLDWSHDQLPSLPKLVNAHTRIASYTAKQCVVVLDVPADTPPGHYASTVTVSPVNGVTKTATLNIEVLPFKLLPADRDFITYHRGRYDVAQTNEDYVSEARYDAQLADMKAHGFTGIFVYGRDTGYLDKVVSSGFTGPVIFPGFDATLKNTMEQYGLAPYFYGYDEPNTDERLIHHITESITIHEGGGKVITAIKKSSADRLNDADDPIYLNFPKGTYEPLDYINLSAGAPEDVDYFHALIAGTAVRQEPTSYYWQMMQEDPRINRFHAGYFLWLTGLDGVFPYVYQHVRNNPYDDFGPWADTSPTFRHHLVTYPSREGPVPTMQWEALREGIDDIRYLTTWQDLHRQVVDIDSGAAAQSKAVIDALLEKYKDYYSHKQLSVEQFALDREVIKDEIIRLINACHRYKNGSCR